MSADWFLIVIILIMLGALLAVNVYILVYFQHPDDKNTAIIPKFLVIFGLLFAEASVLLLPLDVANKSTLIGCEEGWNLACGGLDMNTFWLIVFLMIIIMIVILLPFSIYYYEAQDGVESQNALTEACKLQTCTLIVTLMVLLTLYLTSAKTHIPIHQVTQSANEQMYSIPRGGFLTTEEHQQAQKATTITIDINMDVSFPIYITAIMSFVGWFSFVIFGGIGLVALPLDLILAFVYRPKYMPADIYAQHKLTLQERTAELIELGTSIKQGASRMAKGPKRSMWERRKQSKLDRITMNKFKQAVYLLEQDTEDLQACHQQFREYNPLIAFGKLVLGMLSLILTLLWTIQIVLVLVVPDRLLGGFLSDYFMWFDKWFPLFGTISVGIFSMYLLAAVVGGCFKFGVRCFCCALHPMKLNKTYMNSFLFNLGLILLCCIPVVQFCNDVFSDYTRLTEIQQIMGTQIRHLQYFSIFWEHHIFVYALLGVMLITLMYLFFNPNDRASSVEEMRERIEKNIREHQVET